MRIAAVAIVFLSSFRLAATAGAAPVAIEVTPVPDARGTEIREYPVRDRALRTVGSQQWLLVEPTGNCCENYLASSASGALFDLGGSRLRTSADGGLSWSVVPGATPIVNAEGAVSAAPGGDVVGATWDAYSGDRIVSFRYDAAAARWYSMVVPIHTPFFDRPWIAVMPGPVSIAGQTAPYLVVLKGGWPSKEVLYHSLDGLNYTSASAPTLALTRGSFPAAIPADADSDWIQPLTAGAITPVAGHGALTRSPLCSAAKLARDGSWSCVDDISPLPGGRMLVDSRGWIHVADPRFGRAAFASSTDGVTWSTVEVPLGHGIEVKSWDFKANARAGVAALALQVHQNDVDRFLVLRLDIAAPEPRLDRIFEIGEGDVAFGGGITSMSRRFDFATVTILADGRIATSFADDEHHPPTVAIER